MHCIIFVQLNKMDVDMLKLCSSESIGFQTNGSPLANDLITMFQEVIDYRETEQTVMKRIKNVRNFFVSKTVPKLKAAIKKHTGITCASVSVSKTCDFGFACLMNFGDNMGLTAHDVINRYSGLETDPMVLDYMRYKGIKPKSAEDMRVVAESLQYETGYFTANKLKGNIECTMTLYFDPFGAFLVKECGHDKAEYLTAEEITGIILHEIGHMISTLAHSADLCFRSLVYNRSLEYFLKNADTKQKSEFVKKNINKLTPELAEKASQALDQCTATDQGSQYGSWIANVFNIFIVMLIELFNIPFVALFLVLEPVSDFFGEFLTGGGWNKKMSDYADLPKQLKVCEQFADEYVAKHGMAHTQASALRKLWDFAAFQMGTYVVGNRTCALWYHLNKATFYVYTLLFGDVTDGGGTYDNRSDRAKRLLMETTKALKNTNMSPEMVQFFITDYEKTKLELTKNKSTAHKFGDLMNTIRGALKYLITSLPAMLVSGRFSTEYKNLFNKAEQLMSNSLFYRASKLEQIIRKMK